MCLTSWKESSALFSGGPLWMISSLFLLGTNLIELRVWWTNEWYRNFDTVRTCCMKVNSVLQFDAGPHLAFHDSVPRCFMSSGFQRSGDSWTRKMTVSWKCQCMQFIVEEINMCFFHWARKAITIFPNSLLEEGNTVPVPTVRFCIGFQRFRFLRFTSYLMFYGSVPRCSRLPLRFQNHHDSSHDSDLSI